ncbi:ubiquitin-conjugating enzyme E2 32 isoform X2 [Phoenix dactylifera]|uniref:Ubiquitin-conjugating enzyme E2 32 isoform X2 n=1 Tax=Phoenix dactylifera TaxID=42345 RepID=A0A8B8IZL9_PHODC|nr:ubiquitin-conjugating enzyme E2 32 isoform X2 [Phoenix dactylifera]
MASAAEDKYNRKNPAVKRILQEVKEMQSNPSEDFMSLPLEENIFEWQFAILGPRDSEFEGGIYHGRIQLPADYPFNPPSFMMLTPNGRFETQTKICLSISNHHPEHWQPSWSVRTALVALIAFMPTNPDGALGSLDYKKEERRALAIKSRETPPRFGTPERQNLIDEIPSTATTGEEPNNAASEEEQMETPDSNAVVPAEQHPHLELEQRLVEDVREVRVNGAAGGIRFSFSAGVRLSRRVPAAATDEQAQGNEARVRKPPMDDRLFTWAAIGLTVAIVILLVKKFLKLHGIAAGYLDIP